MATTQHKDHDFRNSLSKVDTFLQDLLSRETLSLDTEKQRQECIRYVQEMMSATGMNGRDSNLLRVGLSHSTQELNNTAVDDTAAVNGITRSDSLPDVCAIQGLHKYSDLQQDVNIDDFRQLILYEPIQEEGENDDDDTETDDKLKLSSNNIKDVCMSPKRSRKRDSAALFDITLGDLTEPDFAGFLTEKHSGKQWWCVLQDMHLCMFPSKDPDEVAYDVIIMPCCQITLDDRLLRTPVFRLTQSDMAPWVLVAKDTHCLKEWMNVLTVATTGGSFGATNKPPDKPTSKVAAKPQMFAIEEEEDDSVEEIPEEVQLTPLTSFSGEVCSQSIESSEFKNETVEVAETSNSNPASEVPPVLPTMTFNDDQDYGEDLYEPIVPNQGEEFEDDGFATDEFDSGSSDGEAASSNALASPQQGRKAKKKKFFKWLKKKSKKYKLFSSPEDGVTLAGYAQRLDNSTCTKRWLLIREGKLHCFKTIKDEEPEVIIVLDGTDIKVGDEEKNKMCVKVLKDGTIKFVLVAKSQKDLERWKTALKVESGFIKHGSPTSSGIYEEEEEGDYVMPTPSPGLQRTSFLSSSPPKDDCDGFGGHEDEEDLYMEVIPTSTTPASIPHSPSHEGLGPLPAIPPDLPPRPVKSEEVESDDESDYEVYEEVGTSLPHADKVNQWDDKEAKTNYEEEDLYLNDIGRREESESEVDLKDLQEKTDVEPMEDKKLVVKIEENKAKGPVSAGMEDGSILDSAITASSFLENSKPSLGRLNTRGTGKQTGAWCPKNNDKAQFLQLDLGDTIKMCAVATQGRADFVEDGGWYVKTYTVAYSKDGENWVNYKEFGIAKVFQGNTDAETTVTNHLKRAVNARYVRIKPQAWNNHIAMRIEVYKGEASSKLEAGIHKLAATLTKAGKGKTFDKQLTSPTETLATKSNGVDEIASPTEKSPLASRVSFDKYVCIIGAEQSTEETKQEQQSAREDEDDKKASREELDVETKVQQNIKEFKQAEGGVKQSISRAEAPGSILAKRNLYENGNQSSSETKGGETKKNVKSGSTTLEKNADKTDTTTTSVSVTATDREREMLEKTEQVFQDYAKKLKSDGTPLKEKRPSIVAMQKMNFESPLVGKESKSQTRNQTPAKCQELLKEKAELTTKLEALKRRVAIAKDRKVFFGRSDGKNTAAAAADKELQSAQTELTKTKERLQAIESEAKNAKVLELRYQKTTVDNFSKKPAPLIRRNSREVKVGTLDCKPAPKVDSKNFNPDGQKAQRGSVLSQIKAFEKLKE